MFAYPGFTMDSIDTQLYEHNQFDGDTETQAGYDTKPLQTECRCC